MKTELRRMLFAGQTVRVSRLSPETEGLTGKVVKLCERGVDTDSITSEGTWTVAIADPVNGGYLNREFQRRYLRVGGRNAA